jgi:hypothetical protein
MIAMLCKQTTASLDTIGNATNEVLDRSAALRTELEV